MFFTTSLRIKSFSFVLLYLHRPS